MDEVKRKVTTVEQIKKGLSKSSKPIGGANDNSASQRRIVKVVTQEWRLKQRQKKGQPPAWDWKTVETHAEFEGPTAHHSAEQFILMMEKCTVDSGARCVADGVALTKIAKKSGTWEEFKMPL